MFEWITIICIVHVVWVWVDSVKPGDGETEKKGEFREAENFFDKVIKNIVKFYTILFYSILQF